MGTQVLPRTVPTPTVGTAFVQVVGENPTRNALVIYNPNATALLSVSALDTTPILNGSGTITLPVGTGLTLEGWTAGLNAIASSAGSKISVMEF